MTTRCTGWKVERQDAVVEGYTDHDTTLVVAGQTYLSSAGYVPSAVERKSNLAADNQQLVGLIDNVNLTVSDLLAGIYDGARLEILQLDWEALTVVRTLLVAHMGEVSVAGNQYTIKFASIEAEFQKQMGGRTEIRCPHDLGDSACGFALTTDSGTVDSLTTARRVFVDASLAQADGYYNGGKVEWTTGDNAGRVSDVKRYVSATNAVELFEPLPSDIQVGDTYEISRGCDKTMEVCVATFSNGVRFGGQPYVPGESNLVTGNTGNP